MNELPLAVKAIYAVLAAGSLATWSLVLWRRLRGGEIVPYEPRWRVPWGAAAGFSVLLFVVVALSGEPAADREEAPGKSLVDAVQTAVVFAVFLGAMGLVLMTVTGAKARDFGVPTGVRQALSDVRLGLLAFFATYFPAVMIYVVLNQVTGNTLHPEIQRLQADPDARLFVAVFLTAGLMAPVLEEVLFRLMLQGWLEKAEDTLLGFRVTSRPRCPAQGRGDEFDEEALQSRYREPEEEAEDRPDSTPADRVKLVSFGGLGHGWLPVLLSSVVFGLMHTNQGLAQPSLIAFAVALGYVYQRTHRLLPCIIAHVAFNCTTLVIVALMTR